MIVPAPFQGRIRVQLDKTWSPFSVVVFSTSVGCSVVPEGIFTHS